MNKISTNRVLNTPTMDAQYSLAKILLIWFISAAPMAILAFIVTPALIQAFEWPPLIVYWLAIIIGLIWQFVLSLIILKTEGYPLQWTAVRARLKFQKPRNPHTGRTGYRVLWWTIPFILLNAVVSSGIGFPDLDKIIQPITENLPSYDMSALAENDYTGAWWILGLYVVTMVFNYFLGEEFLYRGILLPKMNGVFGKWDWLANGVLFGFYHLHKPQVIISTALLYGFIFAFPAKYFQSSWMAIIIHGLEGILGLVMVLGIILGFS